ncbi:MAG: hypothetical protein HQL32_13820 [Planctomycetes bacterium]|nr:hypothetical protein [Planctomycetota bacterium]
MREPYFKIAYAVAGEGRGHAVKSLSIAAELQRFAEVKFFGGGDAFCLIRETEHDIVEIPCLKLLFRNDRVHIPDTLKYCGSRWLKRKQIIANIKEQLQEYKADFVICDFEYFVPRAAAKLGLPVIQVSHQVVLLTSKIDLPLRYWGNILKTFISSRLIIPNLNNALSVSFFSPPLKKSAEKIGVKIVPACIRGSMKEKVNKGGLAENHVLVYFSCPTFFWIMPILKLFSQEKFIVYGSDKIGMDGDNIEYKRISPTTFQDDLLASKAIITNGGHNLLGEAIYFKKPVFAFYVEGQFEQFLNTYYLEKMQMGSCIRHKKNFQAEFSEFLNKLPQFKDKMEGVNRCGSEVVAGEVYRHLTGKELPTEKSQADTLAMSLEQQ